MDRAKILHTASKVCNFDTRLVVPCFGGFALLPAEPCQVVRDPLASSNAKRAASFGDLDEEVVTESRALVFESLCAMLEYLRAGADERGTPESVLRLSVR